MANPIIKPNQQFSLSMVDIPEGYSLFIKAPGIGGIMHRIQQFATAEEATSACEFFAAHWHESESEFEVWLAGKRLMSIRHKAPDTFENTDSTDSDS